MKPLIALCVFLGLVGCALGYLFDPNSLLTITLIGSVLTFGIIQRTAHRGELSLKLAMGFVIFLLPITSMWATFFVKTKYMT